MRTSNSRASLGSAPGGRYHFLRLYRAQGKHLRRRLARADPRQLALLSFLAVLSIFSFVVYFVTTRVSQGFKDDHQQILVATAYADITPREVVPLSGYAWRNETPANTSVYPAWSPLRARVLVLRAPERFVLITLDVVGIDSAYASSIFHALNQSLGVMRNEVHIVSSHTHSGPFVGRNLWPLLPDGTNNAAVSRYSNFLRTCIVDAVRKALADESAQLASAFFGKGLVEFPVNRRQVEERSFDASSEHGDIDRELPVIWFHSAVSNKIIAGMYGVAAHATVLTKSTQYSGDYPGAVSTALEGLHPGSTWFYLPGCGGDVNIYPRGTVDLLRYHRDSIVTEVQRVVSDRPAAEDVFVGRPTASAKRETIELQFQKQVTAADVKPLVRSKERATRRWARSTLRELKNGNRTAPSYDYEMSLWALGNVKMLFLAGEPTVGYASKLRERADVDWVVGYTDDVVGYVGTADVIGEGKREGSQRAAHYYGLPSTWHPNVEAYIISKACEMCVDA